MSFGVIANLSHEQLLEIIRLRRNVPLASYLAANGKARQACALRHKGWGEKVLICGQAVLVACKNTDLRDALAQATLMSAAESYGLALIAQEDLLLEEYNLLISPVAEVAIPEVILSVQDWEPIPLPKNEAIVRQNYESLKQKDAETHGRRNRSADPDPDGDLVDTGLDPTKALAALLGGKKKKEEEPKVDSKTAIAAMMAKVKKVVHEIPMAIPEPQDKIVIQPSVRENGKFDLVGVQTAKIYNDTPFGKPAEAVVFAVRNRLKLG